MDEETILAADTGTVFLRGGFGGEPLRLGLSPGSDPQGEPDVLIVLTRRQREALRLELRALSQAEGAPDE